MNAWLDYAIKLLPTIISGCSICLALVWRVHALQLKQEITAKCMKAREEFKDKIHEMELGIVKMEMNLLDKFNKKDN